MDDGRYRRIVHRQRILHLTEDRYIHRDSRNMSLIRVGEVHKEALRRNSATLIVAHNQRFRRASPRSRIAGHARDYRGREGDIDAAGSVRGYELDSCA